MAYGDLWSCVEAGLPTPPDHDRSYRRRTAIDNFGDFETIITDQASFKMLRPLAWRGVDETVSLPSRQDYRENVLGF